MREEEDRGQPVCAEAAHIWREGADGKLLRSLPDTAGKMQQLHRRLGSTLAVLLCTAVAHRQAGTEEDEAELLPVILNEGDVYSGHKMELFCYEFIQKPIFTDYWSAVKIKIRSSELLHLTYSSEENFSNRSETLIDLIVHFYYQVASSTETLTSEFNISVERLDRKTCFKVNPMKSHSHYTITVTKPLFQPKLIILFVTGIILFVFARPISRSELFYYSGGVTLGIFAILVLILLVCRRLMQTRTFLFLMIGSGSVSLFVIYLSVLNLSQYRHYFIGYIFVLGCLSYIICHYHGPLSDERSINLLTWTLQLAALLMIYLGVSFSQCAYTVIVILLCANNLHHPVNVICYIYRKIKQFIKKPQVHFITEEEYREQTEMETKKALEELRRCCRSPDFPAWEMVSKIRSPKRFADFILGASHLTHEEVWNHEQHYGIGGSFLEAQIFATEENNGFVLQNGEVMAADEGCEVSETVN
ncbi:nuclear envelope integral membrane protein 1a-like [Pristis pectinata]|uniref:nuclear envelope integral membrane protein 1a-like n=1 Tax=Pristis pectinata TaxID=685728 RepID=UPI00223E7216|nr:nuclear envelope integral membrane protein 1a-like [Pristis pectinata]